MKNGYYGSIDVGTNAARMVIKNVSMTIKGDLDSFRVQEVRVPLRLGVDVFNYGYLKEKKIKQLVDTIYCFKTLMNIYDVIDYKAIATSAMREASNGKEVIEKIKNDTGVNLEIISGEKEASTISKIAKDLKINKTCCFIDVGGGSTEINLFYKDKIIESNSFPLGTLRILAKADKEESRDNFRKKLKSYHKEYGDIDIVGTGGNINRYWKMSPHYERKGQHILFVEDLVKEYKELKDMSLSERMDEFKLKPDRADVIVPAGQIFVEAAEILDSKLIYVPLIGLGDGLIDTLVQENMNII